MESSTVTLVGLTVLVAVAAKKLLEFYGIGVEVYGTYAAFYLFILVSMLILPLE